MAISLRIKFLLLALSVLSVSQAILIEAIDPIFTPFTASSTTTTTLPPPPPPRIMSPLFTLSRPPPPPPSPRIMSPLFTTSLPPPPPSRQMMSPLFSTSPPPPPPSRQMMSPLFSTSPPPPPPSRQMMSPLFTTSPPPPPPSPTPTQNLIMNDHSIFSQISLLAPILSHLGFNELATAATFLSADSSVSAAWAGPFTIFAPFDSSVDTCASCSASSLLPEHVVPGLFTIDYLSKLAFGTKIETISPGRCITVTTTLNSHSNSTVPKVFIGGVEITNPDLFNNGLVIIHGIHGYVSPLSPLSCDIERMMSLSVPLFQDRNPRIEHQPQVPQQQTSQSSLIRLMLRDAMFRLRNNGYTVVSLAMKVKYPELVTLNNMTVFALDDLAIFSAGSHNYIHSVRFHIVPNQLLTFAELQKLPVGATLPSLERGQYLVVTTAGGGATAPPMRINYVRIKVPDVMKNAKIVVHSLFLPFPRIHPAAAAYDGMMTGTGEANHHEVLEGTGLVPL